jgi:hypothetical protein
MTIHLQAKGIDKLIPKNNETSPIYIENDDIQACFVVRVRDTRMKYFQNRTRMFSIQYSILFKHVFYFLLGS